MSRKARENEPPAESVFSVERCRQVTILRLHPRATLPGADLGKISGLWDVLEAKQRPSSPILAIIVGRDLLAMPNLERLVSPPNVDRGPQSIKEQVIREENVTERFITAVRGLDSLVVGVVSGEVVFPLAAPFLACDYRIASEDTVFVNTSQKLPAAPMFGLPWLLWRLVGGTSTARILLDTPRISAPEALELGLVNCLTSTGSIEEEALVIIHRLANLPRATLVGVKRALVTACEDLPTYLQRERTWTRQLSGNPEDAV